MHKLGRGPASVHPAADRGSIGCYRTTGSHLVPSPAASARAERDGWLADVAWPSTGMPARPQASTPCITAQRSQKICRHREFWFVREDWREDESGRCGTALGTALKLLPVQDFKTTLPIASIARHITIESRASRPPNQYHRSPRPTTTTTVQPPLHFAQTASPLSNLDRRHHSKLRQRREPHIEGSPQQQQSLVARNFRRRSNGHPTSIARSSLSASFHSNHNNHQPSSRIVEEGVDDHCV